MIDAIDLLNVQIRISQKDEEIIRKDERNKVLDDVEAKILSDINCFSIKLDGEKVIAIKEDAFKSIFKQLKK